MHSDLPEHVVVTIEILYYFFSSLLTTFIAHPERKHNTVLASIRFESIDHLIVLFLHFHFCFGKHMLKGIGACLLSVLVELVCSH